MPEDHVREVGGPAAVAIKRDSMPLCAESLRLSGWGGVVVDVSAMFPDNLALPPSGTVVPVMLHWRSLRAVARTASVVPFRGPGRRVRALGASGRPAEGDV
jgi:hypothetical protein